MVHFFYCDCLPYAATQGNAQIASRVRAHLAARFGSVAFADHQRVDAALDRIGADDLVIGHPGAAMEHVRRGGRCRRMLLLVPLPPWEELHELATRYSNILLIGGRHWYEDLVEKRRDALPAGTTLHYGHMAVDATMFPRVKTVFAPPGRRSFLFVGRFDQERKNVFGLVDVFAGRSDRLTIVAPTLGPDAPQRERALRDALAAGQYPNIRLAPYHVNVSPEFRALVRSCDVYIHLATFDSQATTILEAIAYGLVPMLSRESGFEYSFGGFVDPHDVDGCRRRLDEVQAAPGAVLESAATAARMRLLSHHGWRSFTAALDRAIDAMVAKEAIAA